MIGPRVTRYVRALCAGSLLFIPAALGAQDSPMERIGWVDGPVIGGLATVAEVEVPEYCRFTDKNGAKLFMEATENTASGSELGIMVCQDANSEDAVWFVVFSFNESGYVRDDERTSLDADGILQSLRRGNDAANKERESRGWEQLVIDGWERAPYYDSLTNNLTWSLRVAAQGSPDLSVNHSVRLLGRKGVMHADLVADPAHMAGAVATFDSILGTYTFVDGQKYAEWREGDKVAAYGLTALVAGGAGVAAAKFGLFGKFWKAIVAFVLAAKKLLIVAVVAIGAFVKRVFGKKQTATA
ncbi:MAG: DUF2167 domain-containing protein [Gemmatimonadaceae bacterium]